MKRRDFVAALGAALAWPPLARAQGSRPILGFLASGEASSFSGSLAGFLTALQDSGFVDGENLIIEYRWAEGHFDRLSALAAELARRPVDVILAAQGTVTALAAKRATSSIPIVFVTADDPVASGLVTSLARPGGNLTGISRLGTALSAKNLELLHQAVPAASTIALLMNSKRPTADQQRKVVQEAAAKFGKTVRVLNGGTEGEIDTAFEIIKSERINALLVPFDSVFNIHRRQIIELAAQSRLPAAYALREFVKDGGLMSYGDSPLESYSLAGRYIARILKGAKPTELPVQQASKLELSLNLRTAQSLGIEIPIALLGRADEVIE